MESMNLSEKSKNKEQRVFNIRCNTNLDNQNEKDFSYDQFSPNYDESFETFEEMRLRRTLLRGIYEYGFEKPSTLQQKSIIPVIRKRDLIVQAQAGTGKSVAYVIGTLQSIDTGINETQVLVLVPTREIAKDIMTIYRILGRHIEGLKIHMLCGGIQLINDINALKFIVHIIVGTPGRVLHMLERKLLIINSIKTLILDETDELMAMGFSEYISDILSFIPPDCALKIFTPTAPPQVIQMSSIYQVDPIKILVRREELTLEGIRQYYIALDKPEWKLEVLFDLYQNLDVVQSIIYCNSKIDVDYLSEEFTKKGCLVAHVHADMTTDETYLQLKSFRSGEKRNIITTDMWSKSKDIMETYLVINYDMPKSKENYIRRIGRGGAYGRKGASILLLLPEEKKDLEDLTRYFNTQIEELPNDLSILDI